MVMSASTGHNGSRKASMSSVNLGRGFKRVSFHKSEYVTFSTKIRKPGEKVKLRIVKYFAGAAVHPGAIDFRG